MEITLHKKPYYNERFIIDKSRLILSRTALQQQLLRFRRQEYFEKNLKLYGVKV